MKVPLAAMSGPQTVNKYNGKQNVLIWKDGEKIVIPSPREHHYYMLHEDGERREVLGKMGPHTPRPKYKKYNVENISELSPEILPPLAQIDGVTRNEIERICIEHGDFFKSYPSQEPTSLGFDFEVHSADGSFPKGEKHPIVSIGVVTDKGDQIAFMWDGESDYDCIMQFVKFIKNYDPDIIYGYNIIGYDIPQLFSRAEFHGIEIKSYLNREGRKGYGWESDFSYHKKSRIQSWGRIIIDVFNFASRDYALSGQPKSLKSVGAFYGMNPISLEFDGKDILDYTEEEIKEYVISDCVTTKWLFNHYFPQHKFIAELLKVPLESYINGADSFITKVLQGRALFKKNILTFDKNIDRHPDINSFQAAHIDLYKPGFHRHNYKVDFASMYPSIAMSLNLGPDTTKVIGYEDYDITKFGCQSEMKRGTAMLLTIPDNVVNKNILVQVQTDEKSCLYTMCKQFNEMRQPYKTMDTHEGKSKSNAFKIMVNTFYGANTNPYMSYGDLSVGIAITGLARWLILGAKSLIQKRYGDDSVVYIHTDGINTNTDVDTEWLNKELQRGMDSLFPLCESEWIKVDKDTFDEGYWIKIGNYVLRNKDKSLVKHGSTFKSKGRSGFYTKVLDKIINARLDNTVDHDFIKDLYEFDNYVLEDFLQMRTMNKNIKDYKSENDLIVQLANEGKTIGMDVRAGTTFSFYKANDGYKLERQIDNIDNIDMKYHWQIINTLLKKFGLDSWIRKTPSITVIDKNQKSLLEFV